MIFIQIICSLNPSFHNIVLLSLLEYALLFTNFFETLEFLLITNIHSTPIFEGIQSILSIAIKPESGIIHTLFLNSNLVNTLSRLTGTNEKYDQLFNGLIPLSNVPPGKTIKNSTQLDEIRSTITKIITLLNQEDCQNELPSLITSLFQGISPNQLECHASFAPLWKAFIDCFQSHDLKKQRALIKGLFAGREQGVNAEIILQFLHAALHTVIPYCPVRFFTQTK